MSKVKQFTPGPVNSTTSLSAVPTHSLHPQGTTLDLLFIFFCPDQKTAFGWAIFQRDLSKVKWVHVLLFLKSTQCLPMTCDTRGGIQGSLGMGPIPSFSLLLFSEELNALLHQNFIVPWMGPFLHISESVLLLFLLSGMAFYTLFI